MPSFTVFPAIDLRHGKIVRLQEGDPERETHYFSTPGLAAENWLQAGASWLHVVNLDGAFGEADSANQQALLEILEKAAKYHANVQFGGGLHSLPAIDRAFEMGFSRLVVGTLAIEHPELMTDLINRYGPDRIAASLDVRKGLAQIHGWQSSTSKTVLDAALDLRRAGLKWLVYTDIVRDGLLNGLNVKAAASIAQVSGLNVIASGGVNGWQDIEAARQAGLAGVIVGKALYEGLLDPRSLFNLMRKP